MVDWLECVEGTFRSVSELSEIETGGAQPMRVNRAIGAGAVRSRCGLACGRFEELSHGVLGTPCVVAVGLGEVVESFLDPHDGDSKVGQAGEVSR